MIGTHRDAEGQGSGRSRCQERRHPPSPLTAKPATRVTPMRPRQHADDLEKKMLETESQRGASVLDDAIPGTHRSGKRGASNRKHRGGCSGGAPPLHIGPATRNDAASVHEVEQGAAEIRITTTLPPATMRPQ